MLRTQKPLEAAVVLPPVSPLLKPRPLLFAATIGECARAQAGVNSKRKKPRSAARCCSRSRSLEPNPVQDSIRSTPASSQTQPATGWDALDNIINCFGLLASARLPANQQLFGNKDTKSVSCRA